MSSTHTPQQPYSSVYDTSSGGNGSNIESTQSQPPTAASTSSYGHGQSQSQTPQQNMYYSQRPYGYYNPADPSSMYNNYPTSGQTQQQQQQAQQQSNISSTYNQYHQSSQPFQFHQPATAATAATAASHSPQTATNPTDQYYQQSQQQPPQSQSQPQSQESKYHANPSFLPPQQSHLNTPSVVASDKPVKPRVATTFWEDENTVCYQVEARGIQVSRREDTNFVNGTKLLNVAGMTRGRRDGILKTEKVRYVVKIGAMNLKGVWIPFERALELARNEGIADLLYPLFIKDIKTFYQGPGASMPSNIPLPQTGVSGSASVSTTASNLVGGQPRYDAATASSGGAYPYYYQSPQYSYSTAPQYAQYSQPGSNPSTAGSTATPQAAIGGRNAGQYYYGGYSQSQQQSSSQQNAEYKK